MSPASTSAGSRAFCASAESRPGMMSQNSSCNLRATGRALSAPSLRPRYAAARLASRRSGSRERQPKRSQQRLCRQAEQLP